jgi:hypothetical protein
MSIQDFGMLFEKIVEAYWGSPKTPIYFSNYWGKNFETRAILYSIIIKEINYNPEKYNEDILESLKEYASKSSNGGLSYTENASLLELLAKHKNIM